MANNFSLNRNVTTAWAAQIKAQKGVMLEPQVRKSGTGFKVVHRMPFASLLHGLLWKISKGYRNNRIEERHAFLNVLEDQVRGSYGLENKYSSNGHRLANPEEGKPILGTLQSALAPAGNPGGSPALPSKCYEKLKNDTEPSALLFNRINAARENASVNRKAYMTSLHEVFLGIATEDPYSEADDVASFKQEWRKPKDATSDNKLAEACRRETVAYEAKRQKATGGSYISEAMEILPPVAQTPRAAAPIHTRHAPPPPVDALTQRQDPDYDILHPGDFYGSTPGYAQSNEFQDSITQNLEEISVEIGTTPLLPPRRGRQEPLPPLPARPVDSTYAEINRPGTRRDRTYEVVPPTLQEATQDIPPPKDLPSDNDLEQTLTPASGLERTQTDREPRQKPDGEITAL